MAAPDISHIRMEKDFKNESENSVPAKPDGQQNSDNSNPIGLNFQIIRTPPGIMLIINIVSIEYIANKHTLKLNHYILTFRIFSKLSIKTPERLF